jgi:hypothetical protein
VGGFAASRAFATALGRPAVVRTTPAPSPGGAIGQGAGTTGRAPHARHRVGGARGGRASCIGGEFGRVRAHGARCRRRAACACGRAAWSLPALEPRGPRLELAGSFPEQPAAAGPGLARRGHRARWEAARAGIGGSRGVAAGPAPASPSPTDLGPQPAVIVGGGRARRRVLVDVARSTASPASCPRSPGWPSSRPSGRGGMLRRRSSLSPMDRPTALTTARVQVDAARRLSPPSGGSASPRSAFRGLPRRGTGRLRSPQLLPTPPSRPAADSTATASPAAARVVIDASAVIGRSGSGIWPPSSPGGGRYDREAGRGHRGCDRGGRLTVTGDRGTYDMGRAATPGREGQDRRDDLEIRGPRATRDRRRGWSPRRRRDGGGRQAAGGRRQPGLLAGRGPGDGLRPRADRRVGRGQARQATSPVQAQGRPQLLERASVVLEEGRRSRRRAT